ncbi:hypothetical protein [Demequina sp.]|uniref:hypothetical protein n=1 Tax=Demequina sp. TaxID=2050685 RepID=UPI0025BB30F2|nr:hypothetical protein [Demequina sp.]
MAQRSESTSAILVMILAVVGAAALLVVLMGPSVVMAAARDAVDFFEGDDADTTPTTEVAAEPTEQDDAAQDDAALDGAEFDAAFSSGGEPSPLAVSGDLLPAGVPVDIDMVDFFDNVHPMTVTIDGVTQRGECTVVLMQVTPDAELGGFDLPTVGIVSGGLHYEGGGCDTTGLEDAGYASSIGLEIPAGQTAAYYDFAQRPDGTLAEVEAVTVEVAEGEYLFFEPVEKTLT